MSQSPSAGFPYPNSRPCHTNAYLMPAVLGVLTGLSWPTGPRRVFDLGCGNGAVAAELVRQGYTVSGVDPSEEGIRIANMAYPELPLRVGSAYDNLAAQYGQFPVVISLEVVEHLYAPRRFARCLFDLLEPGGTAVVSTPYHGYWKNLALALTGKLDGHFTALWDHGHIKFWSIRTLTVLLEEAGLRCQRFLRVGRIPPLAKSMIAVAQRPR